MKLKGISLICIISLFFQIIVFDIPVFAVEEIVPVPGYSELKEMDEDIKNGDNRTLQDIWNTLQPIGSAIGIVMNPIQTIEFIRDIVDPVAESLPEYPTNGTETEKANYISSYLVNNTSIDDGTKTYSLNQNAKNLVNGIINNYINETGFRYVYTFNIINHATEFASGDAYQITRDFIETYQQEGKVCAYSNYYQKIMLADLSNCAFVRTSDVSGRYEVTPYNLNTWEAVRGYEYSFNGTQYTATGASGNQMRAQVKVAPTQTGELGLWSWCTSGKNNVYKMYMSLADLKADSVGQAPYYINNSVYNDFSTSSGDYTVNTDNSNNATYGDITSYIDSFNTEYGRYPSDTDIFKWIEDYNPTVNPTPTPGPDNPSGSGSFVNNNSPSITNNPTFNNNPNINITLFPSVSDNGLNGGTVSGNGGQGSIGNIFDWMGNLGNVIANLIKNVGEMIVKALQGVIEAVTTILNGIPNILTPIIEFVFGGLPDELQALISLGITCIIFVGIIKVIKR